MCGISAVVALDGINAVSLDKSIYLQKLTRTLDESLDSIKHRGPDARGQWISENNRIALGHVRLAITDLTPAGEQPFRNEQGNVHAVVNGELYGHELLREELAGSYQFKGNSDCEIVIALYLEYGLHFLSKLRGEFALCLYDERRQMFVAARDRFGIKPLFWTVLEDRLLVASEAKAFLSLGWKPEWDVRSLVEDGWLHSGRTLFKGIHKIQPGHYLTCSSFSYMMERQYWDITFPDKRLLETRTEQEMILGLRHQMLEAVRHRLRADVKVGLYLSGGIDSAVIAGMAAHLVEEDWVKIGTDLRSAKQDLTCFSVGFEEGTEFDEMPIAQRTADFLGLPLVQKRMDEEALAENFEDAVYHSEHHNPDLNSVAKYALSELPRANGFKVVLSGEGSDEHFGGYRNFLPDFFREPDLAWNEHLISDLERAELTAVKEQETQPGYKGIDQAFVTKGSLTARRMLNDTSISSCLWTVTLAHFAKWTRCYGDLDVQQSRADNPPGRILDLMNSKWHPLHTSQYVWTKSILPNLILTCMGDRMEMAHSIEGRPPFLDHILTEYINNLPPSMKIRYDVTSGEAVEKWILREASKPFITEELYKRKKHPFTAPITYSHNGPLSNLLSRLITRANIEQLGFVDWGKAEGLVEKAFHEKDASAMRYALTVAQWVVLGQRFGVKKAEPIL